MSFNIKFQNKINEEGYQVGKITIGEFAEDLIIPTTLWGKEEYLQQWKKALHTIISSEHSVSGLVTEIHPEEQGEYVGCWPMYREGERVYIQNRLLFREQHPEFNPDRIQDFVGKREVTDKDGNQISEWSTGVHDIVHFMKSL